MGRHTGPVEKLSRREGVELFLKGERALNGKSALERRGPNPPGQHGADRRRKASIYSTQLRAKQTAKRYYGVRERQFRQLREGLANRAQGVTGEELLRAARAAAGQRRLPARVRRHARAGAAVRQPRPRAGGRQQGRHRVVPGQARDDGHDQGAVRELASAATELTGSVPAGCRPTSTGSRARVLRLPERGEINAPVEEQLIVELYSTPLVRRGSRRGRCGRGRSPAAGRATARARCRAGPTRGRWRRPRSTARWCGSCPASPRRR